MSRRISLKKLGERVEKARGESSSQKSGPPPLKGIIIGEKRPADEPPSSPSKKAKSGDDKGKGQAPIPESKKKSGPAHPIAPTSGPGEGSSPSLGTVLGPRASILGSPSVAEKILRGVIPPTDQEKVGQLTLDQTASKFIHALGQVLF